MSDVGRERERHQSGRKEIGVRQNVVQPAYFWSSSLFSDSILFYNKEVSLLFSVDAIVGNILLLSIFFFLINPVMLNK